MTCAPPIEDHFWWHAATGGSAIATVDTNGEESTRAELLGEANQISNGLIELGLKTGDVVAVAMPNCRQWIALYLACSQIGLYFLPVNWALSEDELTYVLSDSEASVLFTHASLGRIAKGIAAIAGGIRYRISVGQVASCSLYEDFIRHQHRGEPRVRRAGDVLCYTSGTTGRPKAVLRRLTNQLPEAQYKDSLEWRKKVLGIPTGHSACYLVCSPLYNFGSLLWTIHALHMGQKLVLSQGWHPQAILSLISRYRVGITCMVPTHFSSLLSLPDSVRARYDLSCLTHVVHGSAPCPVDVKRRMIDWLGPVLFESYASTEIGKTMVTSSEWLLFPGTVGKAQSPCKVIILDDYGKPVPKGQRGLVYLHLPENVDFVYKGDEEKTRRSRVGSFVTVGDIGYLNDEDYLFLCDRTSDTIISRGSNIYPAEVEGAMMAHKDVADCVAIGVPHPQWGEEVRLFVRPRPGVNRQGELAAELLHFLSGKIARYKCPSEIEFTDEIPRDENGKLYRRRLKDRYWRNNGRPI